MNVYNPDHISSRHTFSVGVKVVLLNSAHEILLLRRSDKASRPYGWDLPGGGVDQGENPTTAAIREVDEETNLEIDDISPVNTALWLNDYEEVIIIGFMGHVNGCDITLSWEHEAYKWVRFDSVDSLPIPQLHKDIVHATRARIEAK